MNDAPLKNLLAGSSPEGFTPGFSDRVMTRLRAKRIAPLFAAALARRFRRVAAIALLLIAGLTIYNVAALPVAGHPSLLEEALGVPPLTVETAYALDLSSDQGQGLNGE